jgi:hypothetical protein
MDAKPRAGQDGTYLQVGKSASEKVKVLSFDTRGLLKEAIALQACPRTHHFPAHAGGGCAILVCFY